MKISNVREDGGCYEFVIYEREMNVTNSNVRRWMLQTRNNET